MTRKGETVAGFQELREASGKINRGAQSRGPLARWANSVQRSVVRLILASGSPRRRELLAREGVTFTVQPSNAEEFPPGHLDPVSLARENSLLKARDIFGRNPDELVLGSDTVVVVDDQTLGKPRDLNEGARMLRMLSGRWHEVVTGVALLSKGGQEVFHETTRVRFKELNDDEIASYQADVHVLDKAGGYAIQDGGERIIAEVDGCRDNVMGLPVTRVVAKLKEISS